MPDRPTHPAVMAVTISVRIPMVASSSCFAFMSRGRVRVIRLDILKVVEADLVPYRPLLFFGLLAPTEKVDAYEPGCLVLLAVEPMPRPGIGISVCLVTDRAKSEIAVIFLVTHRSFSPWWWSGGGPGISLRC